jgi:hypothetical protein
LARGLDDLVEGYLKMQNASNNASLDRSPVEGIAES